MALFEKPEMTLADYYKQIENAQEKIQELRAKCNHFTFEVHMYMWRPGAMQPQRICTYCDAVVPGVTEEETSKAWEEWNKTVNEGTNQASSFTVKNE